MGARRALGAALALAAVALATGADVVPAASAAAPSYYVSLGDSLAAGFQPGKGDTDRGYTDLVTTALNSSAAPVRQQKFGCSGETVRSLLGRSVCASRFPGGSQLTAATSFLRTHHGQTKYLSLDIGANDVSACAKPSGVDLACAAAALTIVTSGLATVLDRLHAADPSVPVTVGVTYYDPYLAAVLAGGSQFAEQSLTLEGTLNVLESALYGRYGYRVADVATAFHTGQTTPRATVPGHGSQPADVAYVCRLTYICTRGDIHPNDDGYRVMAQTVLAAIRH